MKYKMLILDFDGTIADTRESIVQTMNYVAQEMHIGQIDENQIKNLIGLPLKTTFENAFKLDEILINEAVTIYRNNYKRIAMNTVHLFENVKETLYYIHNKGIVLTIASSKGKVALVEILKKLDIYGLFSFIGGEEEVKNKKPAPDIVNLILQKQNCLPKEALVIGDTIFDIEMGQGAGTDTCGITYGNGTKEQLENLNPTYIIDSFNELIGIALNNIP